MDYQQPPKIQYVQAVTIPADAVEVDLSREGPHVRSAVPRHAISAEMRVTIAPASGGLLVYSPAMPGPPLRLKGPVAQVDIPLSGAKIYVAAVDGARAWDFQVVSWMDDLH